MAKKNSGVKVEMTNQNRDNFTNSAEMMEFCMKSAVKIQQKAEKMSDSTYQIDSYYGRHRLHIMIMPSTWKSVMDNMKNNTLLKAMGG